MAPPDPIERGDELTLAGDAGVVASPPAPELTRGTVVGRYVVLTRLGEGGMGVVYAAYDPELDRKVALKLLHPGDAPAIRASEGRARLLREAQAMAKLSHPNVVAVHDVGTFGEQVFIALELVEGRTLTKWCRETPRTWREVLEVMDRAGRGLAAAHDAGVMHRDFKPDNVMIGADGRVRVMDFGLARAAGDDVPWILDTQATPEVRALAIAVTRQGALVGTPAYMAPEQLAGGAIDARTDIFAFAVSTWELLYGSRPFQGTTIAELAGNVLGGRVVAPPRASRVPPRLRRALGRALAVEPSDRFARMEELLGVLGHDPARHRRRWAVAISLAAIPCAVIGWQRIEQTRAAAACEALALAPLAGWDDGRRAAVRDGMIATGIAYAPVTVEKMQPWLDTYAIALQSMRGDICRAAVIRHEIDAEARALGDACLDDREQAFHHLVGGLAHPTPRLVHDAVMAASSLPLLATCRDERVLASRARTIGRPGRNGAAHAMLEQGYVSERNGDSLVALDSFERGRDFARDEGNRVLEATAELRIAKAAAELGRGEEAERAAEAAYYIAGTEGLDEAAAEAAGILVKVLSSDLARPDDALQWAEHAKMVQARIGLGVDDLREMGLANATARAHQMAGRPQAAYVDAEQARAIADRTLGPEHPTTAVLLGMVGYNLYTLGRYEEAIATFERALPLLEDGLGRDHPLYAGTLSNAAIAYAARGRDDDALATHLRALAIREASLPPDHPEIAISLNGIGTIHHGRGELERAEQYLTRTLAIFERARPDGHPDIAAAATNLGSVELSRGVLDRALAHHRRALAIYEKVFGADHLDVALALANIALVHERQGDLKNAELVLRRALAIREATLEARHPDVAAARVQLGSIARQLGHHDEAVALLEAALASLQASDADPRTTTQARHELGLALWDENHDRTRARALIERAFAEYAELEGVSEPRAELERWLAEHR